MPKYRVITFYKFVKLDDYQELRRPLQKFCEERNIKGTILLAKEGINSTVSGAPEKIEELLDYLKSDQRLTDLEYKESFDEEETFYRMKVKLKKEIVHLGLPEVDPNKKVGTYVDPQNWNKLLEDPEVIVIDTRNDYEYEIGTFKNAIDPQTAEFEEFPDYVQKNLDPKKHKKVAMFCTGGIRCEKATSYMLDQGFEEVYHLKGGILKYLEDIPQEESLWKGDCFVFDNRVSVTHGLEIGSHELCFACRYPISEEDKTSPHYEEGLSCPRCHGTHSPEQIESFKERRKQMLLAQERGTRHIGRDYSES